MHLAEPLPPLRDRIKPGVRVLFVGINPGIRSSQTGHHFAGPSNRFWKLLFESGLTAERITFEDDDRLPEFGYGITNIVPRPTPGIDTILPLEYVAGRLALRRKILRFKPSIVAMVGVTVYRAMFPERKGPVHARATGRDGSARRKCSCCRTQRPKRQFHLRGNARGVSVVEAAALRGEVGLFRARSSSAC